MNENKNIDPSTNKNSKTTNASIDNQGKKDHSAPAVWAKLVLILLYLIFSFTILLLLHVCFLFNMFNLHSI